MSTQTDVKSVTLAAAGALGIGGTNQNLVRVKAVYFNVTASTSGVVSLLDGNGGVSRFSISVPVGSGYLLLPGEGIRYTNDVYLIFGGTVTGSVTVFYG
jgi:hypothetical protein